MASWPARLTLATLTVALALAHSRAWAQRFVDPGYGDPYGTYGVGNTSGPSNPSPAPPLPSNYGPSAPMTPGAPSRPAGWPGGPQDPQAPPATPVQPGVPQRGAMQPGAPQMPASGFVPPGAPPGAMYGAPLPPQLQGNVPPVARPPLGEGEINPAEILAHVGSERIQASEVMPMVHRAMETVLEKNAEEIAKLPPEVRDRELGKLKREYIKQATIDMVKFKLVLAELRGKVPEEGFKKSETKIREYFNTTYIKHLMTEYKAASIPELENKLVAVGSSLDAQRTVFVEQTMARSWLDSQIKETREPTHDEMVAYYREHLSDWETPARVRWEQLTAKFSNFSSKAEAHAALARWGNDVMLRGIPFAQVAKANSQEFAADDGGVHDWASKGSLRSSVLDEALFTLPVGVLSRMLEDEDGVHIVRVIERHDAKRAPFADVQADIKQKLHDGGQDKQRMQYLAKLREHTPVWTAFEDELTAQKQAATSTTR